MISEYHYVKWRDWAKTVKELYNNRCAFCGIEYNGDYQTRIEAHHIIEASVKPELKCALENGIALCRRCHFKAHDGRYQNHITCTSTGETRSFFKKNDASPERAFTFRVFDTRFIFDDNEYQEIKLAADLEGKSINDFIIDAVDSYIAAASTGPAMPPDPDTQPDTSTSTATP